MRIVQAVFGVFHHFELARELDRRGHLQKVYSTWPWARLRQEGLPHAKVETFPWIHTTEILLNRYGLGNRWIDDHLGYANALAFDRWTERRVSSRESKCDVLIAISGAGLLTGQRLQATGGKFICDRGSTHQRFQADINRSEYRRWGLSIESSDPRDTAREEAIYAIADAITVPSSYARHSFIEMGVLAEKVLIIPYGVRLERFAKVADPNPDTFDVLYVGGISMHKGIPYLLQAFAALRHPTKRLRMVGALNREMKPILDKLPQKDVEFLGHVPQTKLKDLMSRSHVLVLPSIDDGFGMVLNQAMACGCPVIATTNSGGPDLITEGEDGWVVPIRDPEAIRDRMERLATNPALRGQMGANAQRKVSQSNGWERYGDSWEQLLSSTVRSG